MENTLQEQLIYAELTAKEIRQTLSDATDKIRELKIAIYKEKTGFVIGDKVKFNYGGEKTGEVIGFQYKYSEVNVIVAFHKKDGSVGQRTKDYWYSGLPVKI